MNSRPADSLRANLWSLATRISVCWPVLSTLLILGSPATAAAAAAGVTDAPCPLGAIAVEPGASIQAAVDSAGNGSVFCLKNGMHRAQAVRPRTGQSFFGEGRSVLNGSKLLTNFSREGRYWVASGQWQRGRKHGECAHDTPACNLPEGVFIDDRPLQQVLGKDHLESDEFYFDYANGKVYLADESKLDYDLTRASWIGDYNDPDTFLNMFMSDNGNNRTGWKNERYDELIRSADKENDQAKREHFLQEAETMLMTNGNPIIPLFYYVGFNYYDPKIVHGIYQNILDNHPLNAMWKSGGPPDKQSPKQIAIRTIDR